MLDGLKMMDPDELAIVCRVAGVRSTSNDPAELVTAIVQRVGQTIGSADNDPATVERAALRYLSDTLRVSIAADVQPGAAENRLFVPLLKQAARTMQPFWRVAATGVVLNTRTIREDATRLFERIYWRVLPCPDALDIAREVIDGLPHETAVVSGVETAHSVQGQVAEVATHRSWVEPILLTILILGFSDGKFHKEEERYYSQVAQGLGLSLENASALRDQTTGTFWSRRARLSPRNTEKPSEVRANSLKAAYNTLEHVGTFHQLIEIVGDCCVQNVAAQAVPQATTWTRRLLASLTGRTATTINDYPVLRIALWSYIREKGGGAAAE
jgi:hypothetical protein